MYVFVLLYLSYRLILMKKHLLILPVFMIIFLMVSGCRVNKRRHCDDCPHFSYIDRPPRIFIHKFSLI